MKDSRPSDLVAATAEEIVAAIAEDVIRLAMFRRRFLRALDDIGWLTVVGGDWASIGEGGLDFAPLKFKEADAILRDLEDLARSRPGRVLSNVPGRASMFR